MKYIVEVCICLNEREEDNVQRNIDDMNMNQKSWLVNIGFILTPDFMVCGCLFTSCIPYIMELVSGVIPKTQIES